MDKYSIIALVVIVLAISIIILGIAVIHTYPGRVAKKRRHPQTQAIEVTSVLGLIVFPLWLFAIMWAYSDATLGKLYKPAPKELPQTDTGEAESRDKEL